MTKIRIVRSGFWWFVERLDAGGVWVPVETFRDYQAALNYRHRVLSGTTPPPKPLGDSL